MKEMYNKWYLLVDIVIKFLIDEIRYLFFYIYINWCLFYVWKIFYIKLGILF